MMQKIKEIRKAIEAGCYLPALALALTLPDICGQIETGNKGRKSYIDWYDEHVKPLYNDDDAPDYQFDGELCYALRCSLLHEGNFELKDRKGNILVDKFKLHIDKVYGHPNIHSSYLYYEEDEKKIVDLDAYGLCFLICHAACDFYNNCDDKTVFDKYDAVIIDESWTDEEYNSLFKF